MKYGDARVVLTAGIQCGLHSCLRFISPSQFHSDILWLYGACKQSILHRGRSIVLEHEFQQDGLLTWKRIKDTFHFDGNVNVYLSTQQARLSAKFHSHYTGGMLQFLEDYESAFLNIEYVLCHKCMTGDTSQTDIYTDEGKRQIFITNFSQAQSVAHCSTHHAYSSLPSPPPQDNHTHVATVGLPPEDPTPAEMTDFLSFCNALSLDWKVGYKLWQTLTPELCQTLTDKRNAHMPLDSGGGTNLSSTNPSHVNQKPRAHGPTPGSQSIVKTKPKPLPSQYLTANVNQTEASIPVDEDDEQIKTFMAAVQSYTSQSSNVFTCQANLKYIAMLSTAPTDLCIIDGGADSHVGGRHWLPLTPLSGPMVRLANVTGFDDQAARKYGLPIVKAVLKVVIPQKVLYLRSKHLIFNASVQHTLLESYEMQECGLIVDDVHPRHKKDEHNPGTYSVTSQGNDFAIPLQARSALATFQCQKI